LHADIKHLASTPVGRALLTPHATTIAAFVPIVAAAIVLPPIVTIVPISTDINATWTNLKLLRLGCSYLAGTQSY
jgi:hypothetical protein